MDSKKRSRWLFLLCTLACLSMRVCSEQCQPRDCGCTSAAEGLVVDLTRLDDQLAQQRPRPTSNGVQYWISLCTPLILSGNCSSNTLVCAVDQSDSSYTSYGREGSVSYSVQRASDSWSVCVTIAGGDTSRRTHLMITCGALPSDSLEPVVTSVVLANETDVEFSILTTFDCVTPLDVDVPSPAPALAVAPLSNATTTTHSLSSLSSHTPTGPLPSITSSQPSSSSTPQPTPVATSSSTTTPPTPSSMTTHPSSSSTTTPPTPSSMTTHPSSSSATTHPSPSSTTTPPTPSSTTAPPPSSSTTAPPPSSSTTTPPPSSSTTTPPPSSSATTPPPSSSATTHPPSSSATTPPPSSSATTPPTSSSTTTHPGTTRPTFPSTHVHPPSSSLPPTASAPPQPSSSPSSPTAPPQLSCACESCTKNLALSLGVAMPGTAILTFLITIFVVLCCKKAKNKRQYIRLAPTVYFDEDERD